MLKEPKQVDNGIFLYCPQEIVDLIDFRGEANKINKSGRISRKIKTDTLKTNTLLIINYLSNHIATKGETYMKPIHSNRDFRNVCNSKYYRICIEILKKHKLIFVRTRYGKETYRVGQISKQYRWNKSAEELYDMKTIHKHKVTDYRFVKKVMDRCDELQCFKYLKPELVKMTRKCRVYKKKPVKSLNPIKTIDNWIKYYHSYVEGEIYVTKGKQTLIENQFKYGYQRLIYDRIGHIIDPRMYRGLGLEKIREIIDDIYGYFRRQPETFVWVRSKDAITF